VEWIRRNGWGVAAASDGLILIEQGARSRIIPSGFYSFAHAENVHPGHPLAYASGGLVVTGFDSAPADLSSSRIPNELYTFYIKAARKPSTNLQPVVYEVMGSDLVSCAHEPLGLAWLPTSQWQAGSTYRVRMDALVTNWNRPGTAKLFVEMRAVPSGNHPACTALWNSHGRIAWLGSTDIGF
jgi:hypothetical protein